jgi:hypothetical protein
MELTGNFIHYNQKNLNGHVYPEETINDMIEKFEKKIKDGKALGTLGYPKNTDNFSEINFSEVSHKVEDIYIDASTKSIKGVIKILDTESGKLAKSLIESGHELYCRSRGIGSVDSSGYIKDYNLISFDIVHGPDAFANIKEKDFLRKNTEDEGSS